ncbi:MAG: serine hydrolase domain-containing protein [Candidatus Baltobacteraceae bacterium]
MALTALVLPAALAGLWLSTQTPPATENLWIQPANDPWPRYSVAVTPVDETMHYFLVVRAEPDGTVRAFVRNPEANLGAALGTRTVVADGAQLILRAPDSAGVTARLNADGTLTLEALPFGLRTLTFHHPSTDELRWYYPAASTRWSYRPPVEGDDGWPVGTLAQAGLREAPIAALMREIVAERSPELRSPYIQSVAIARHGRLVLDEYFYGFAASVPHDVRSAGKSVTALMVGRAIGDTGRFTPQTPVLAALPQYLPLAHDDARKQAMTVADLMTMSSGLACDDNDDDSPGSESRMQGQSAQPDWYKYTLDLPMLYQPGSRAIYCSAGINLLGAIVSTATGTRLDRYFYERFARPMQFGQYAMWLMPPPTSAAYMGGGDYFRPRDFLKFGQLFLSGGGWNGRQIVDDAWLRASIVQRSVMDPGAAGGGDRYGYGWHLSTLAVDGKAYDLINAGGNGGQLLVIVPALDMVAMIAAGNYGQYPVWNKFIGEVVGAAIRAADSPANPRDRISDARSPL